MPKPAPKGPWFQRFLVRLFTVVFGILTYWLLGFVIDDIGGWPGPSYEEVERRMLDPALTREAARLEAALADVQREISAQQARQNILRDSTTNAQTTMNQLLEFQRLSLEKNVTPTEEEQLALAESQKRFLANQAQYQQLTEQIAGLQEQLRSLQDAQRANTSQLEEAGRPIQAEFSRLRRNHDLLIAAVKLAVLTPLLIAGVWLFLHRRESIYLPLVVAFGIAVAAKVMLVMHEYFPTRYFKYVLILTFLAIVTKALVSLIRTIAFPRPELLLKQFREAYEAFLCPICSYPIRRGPLRYLFWTRRSIKKLHVPPLADNQPDQPYSCPACGTQLFEECSACHHVRHTLLPTCEHCGTARAVEPALLPHRTSGETAS